MPTAAAPGRATPFGRLLTGDTFNYRKAHGKLRRDLLPFKGPVPLTGALTGRPPDGKAPYGEALTRRPLTNYRKAYGKLWGGTLPELGGNFRLCAVNQKRSFFPRAVLFLDLLPFQGPFPHTGALTGKPPPYKGPYGQTALREGPYGEASYEKDPHELQESLREATGRDFTRIAFKGPFPLQGPYGQTALPPYGKAPYGQTALREGPLRGGFLREGPPRITGKLTGSYGEGFYKNWREFPLVCRRPKEGRFFLGLGRFWTFSPLRDLSPLQGPLRADRLTGRPLTGRLLTGGLLRGGFLREAPVITGKLTGRLGPYGKPLTRRDGPYEKGRSLTGYGRPLREDPL